MATYAEKSADDLLQCLSKDIKTLQNEQCDESVYAGEVNQTNKTASSLLEHLHEILSHRLQSPVDSYWNFVKHFTSKSIMNDLNYLNTDYDRSWAWLAIALNEQLLESYFRNFKENAKISGRYYFSDAFVRNREKLVLLQTLLSGLDFIVFNMSPDMSKSSSSSAELNTDKSEKPALTSSLDLPMPASHAEGDSKAANSDSLSRSLENTSASWKIRKKERGPDALLLAGKEHLDLGGTAGDSFKVVSIRGVKSKTKGRGKKKSSSGSLAPAPIREPLKHPQVPTEKEEIDAPVVEGHVSSQTSHKSSDDLSVVPSFQPDEIAEASRLEVVTSSKPKELESKMEMDLVTLEGLKETIRKGEGSLMEEDVKQTEDTALLFDDSGEAEPKDTFPDHLGGASPRTEKERSTARSDSSEAVTSPDELSGNSCDTMLINLPKRPVEITSSDKYATEVSISQNNKLLISLNVCFDTSEELHKLIQVYRYSGRAQLQVCYLLLTDNTVYLLENSEREAGYSRLTGIRYSDLEVVKIGLNWQWMTFIHRRTQEKVKIVTCDEAISRGIVDAVTELTTGHPTLQKCVSLSKEEESEYKQLKQYILLTENEEIPHYCIAYWEQQEGRAPRCRSPPANKTASTELDELPILKGSLQLKTIKLGMLFWKPVYLVLKHDLLLQYNSETDTVVRARYPVHISTFGGCKRLPRENRPNTFMVSLSRTELVFSAKSESDATQWIQAILEATTFKITGRVTHGGRYGIVVSSEKICILQEDGRMDNFEELCSCKLDDIVSVGWDQDLPEYCIVKYDDTESAEGGSGSWLFCFSSSYELGKFETILARLWKDTMHVDLEFNVISNASVRKKARDAIELLQASRQRSDSVIKGRSFIKQDS